MQGMRMIRHLKLKNLLSFGPAGIDLDLAPLNVLIGANGSGKSNLIAALTLLKAAPTDLAPDLVAADDVAGLERLSPGRRQVVLGDLGDLEQEAGDRPWLGALRPVACGVGHGGPPGKTDAT